MKTSFTFNTTEDFTTNFLAYKLIGSSKTNQDLFDLIVQIDLNVGSDEFTEKLYKHFKRWNQELKK